MLTKLPDNVGLLDKLKKLIVSNNYLYELPNTGNNNIQKITSHN